MAQLDYIDETLRSERRLTIQEIASDLREAFYRRNASELEHLLKLLEEDYGFSS